MYSNKSGWKEATNSPPSLTNANPRGISMADLSDSTLLPRRALLAGAAALAASPAAMAAPKPMRADPAFAKKVAAFWKARAATQAAYAVVHDQLEALGAWPSVPGELYATFEHPKCGMLPAPNGGWSLKELTAVSMAKACLAQSWIFRLPDGDPVRLLAESLIPIRVAYDEQVVLHTERKVAIEGRPIPYIIEEDRCAVEVVEHPVVTLDEVKQKIVIAEEVYAFEHDASDKFRQFILDDVLAIADKDSAHV